MLHQLIRRMGVPGITVLITFLAVITSVAIRAIISFTTGDGKLLASEVMVATVIPLIIAPIMSVIFIGLLKQIDESEQKNAQLVSDLQEALAKAKTLSGLLPICASCKKIRDDAGYWHQVEVYIRDHAEVDFSHGLCPDCQDDLAAQIAAFKKKSQK